GDPNERVEALQHIAVYRAGDGYLQGSVSEADAQRGMVELARQMRDLANQPVGRRARLEMALLGMRHRVNNMYLEEWDDLDVYREPAKSVREFVGQIDDDPMAMDLALELVHMARISLDSGDYDVIGDTIQDALMIVAGRMFRGSQSIRMEAGFLLAKALETYYHAGLYLEAVDLFTEAQKYIAIDEQPVECIYYGALCFLGFGSPEETIAYLRTLEPRPDEDLPVPPDAIQFYLAQAEFDFAHQRGSSYGAARQRLEGLRRDYPDTPLLARALLLVGLSRTRDGEPDKAAQALQSAIIEPGLSPEEEILAHLELGLARQKMGLFAKAKDNLIDGLYLFEEQAEDFEDFQDSDLSRRLIFALAETLFSIGDWTKSAMMYEQFLTYYSDHALAWSARYFLGECNRKLGQYNDAKTAFAELAKDAEALEYWRAMADEGLRTVDLEETQLRIGIGQ
ncbi:MAG: tetratricopeptide repeat protein, partial [Proteobacteria bacterium]|nr:tetratricopeptide repeat protein [Pseudomonadota bacterium]